MAFNPDLLARSLPCFQSLFVVLEKCFLGCAYTFLSAYHQTSPKKQLSSWETASALESVLISGSWSPLDFGEEWMEVVVERLRNFAFLIISCNS